MGANINGGLMVKRLRVRDSAAPASYGCNWDVHMAVVDFSKHAGDYSAFNSRVMSSRMAWRGSLSW